ncbi:hypothetical protein, partial [Rhizobium laguerreae]|uniref:hypothetical protein n=1 Tax=Rhizobium laguerreae TaxID=1076926 RepID=UPI001C921D49
MIASEWQIGCPERASRRMAGFTFTQSCHATFSARSTFAVVSHWTASAAFTARNGIQDSCTA